MLIEHCPTLGPMIITTRSSLQPEETKAASQLLQLIDIKPIMTDETRLITPIASAFQQIEQTAKAIRQLNPHGLIGIPTEQLRELEVVSALIEARQRSLENDDLQSRAQLDKKQSLALFAKLKPLVGKAVQGKIDAETVMKAIRSEPDQMQAINTLRHLILRKSDISVGDIEVISAEAGQSSNPDFTASNPYVVHLTVNSINAEHATASCILQGGQDLEPIFQREDFGSRTLQFQLPHDRLVLAGYCMLHGLQITARISLRMTLTAKGPSYKCSLIALENEDRLLASLKAAMVMLTPDLFASLNAPLLDA